MGASADGADITTFLAPPWKENKNYCNLPMNIIRGSNGFLCACVCEKREENQEKGTNLLMRRSLLNCCENT